VSWNTISLRFPSPNTEIENTIKIIRQTIISNEVAKVGSVHTLLMHIALMYVSVGNAEYVEGKATKRAECVEGSDSEAKNRKKN
jgi:hypothetical protein